jgi:hypothetical protein
MACGQVESGTFDRCFLFNSALFVLKKKKKQKSHTIWTFEGERADSVCDVQRSYIN